MFHIGDIVMDAYNGNKGEIYSMDREHIMVHPTNGDPHARTVYTWLNDVKADDPVLVLDHCPHLDSIVSSAADKAAGVVSNAMFNVGALDSTLRNVSWVLRDMMVNCGAMNERAIYNKAQEALSSIHIGYRILRPMSRNDRRGAMLSQKRLPPID